jgi:hypothetical protein
MNSPGTNRRPFEALSHVFAAGALMRAPKQGPLAALVDLTRALAKKQNPAFSPISSSS